jgi:hypothetical protein
VTSRAGWPSSLVAALALVTAGCSKVIDESQIPVVTVPDTGSTPRRATEHATPQPARSTPKRRSPSAR